VAAEIAVVIPNRRGESPAATLASLARQEDVAVETVLVYDRDRRGAPWARNRGLRCARSPLVLFCDNDVIWRPGALVRLCDTLLAARRRDAAVAYAYGPYVEDQRKMFGRRDYDVAALRASNYIDTASLVVAGLHPGWDESLPCLQDWDVWLWFASQGYRGAWAGPEPLFDKYKGARGITARCAVGETRRLLRRRYASL
jgi:glycosyltransferase involved in cell wall biosynthesis